MCQALGHTAPFRSALSPRQAIFYHGIPRGLLEIVLDLQFKDTATSIQVYPWLVVEGNLNSVHNGSSDLHTLVWCTGLGGLEWQLEVMDSLRVMSEESGLSGSDRTSWSESWLGTVVPALVTKYT